MLSFIFGSFAAVLLFVAVLDEVLLERALWGRNLVWWAATFGIVLAVTRAMVDDEERMFDPGVRAEMTLVLSGGFFGTATPCVRVRQESASREAGLAEWRRPVAPRHAPDAWALVYLPAEGVLQVLAAHLRFFPRRWRGRGHTQEVHDEISSLFPLRLMAFAEELISTLVTPIVLALSLPQASVAAAPAAPC